MVNASSEHPDEKSEEIKSESLENWGLSARQRNFIASLLEGDDFFLQQNRSADGAD